VHELSVAQAIADTASAHARDRAVQKVCVRIGYLRQVVPESLLFSWQLVTDGTPLAGCELEIEHVPAVVRCPACLTDTALDLPVLVCGSCGGSDVELVSGEEFQFAALELTG
jgi:hydrogenase nickel incorporation protein HypA/HybF